MWWLLFIVPFLLAASATGSFVALPEMFGVSLCSRWDSCIKMFDQINHDDGLIHVNALIEQTKERKNYFQLYKNKIFNHLIHHHHSYRPQPFLPVSD